MRAVGVIEASVIDEEVVEDFAAEEGFLDDAGDIFESDAAVPDALGVDDDGGAMLALVEAAGLVGPSEVAEAGFLEFLFEGITQALGALGVAASRGGGRRSRALPQMKRWWVKAGMVSGFLSGAWIQSKPGVLVSSIMHGGLGSAGRVKPG